MMDIARLKTVMPAGHPVTGAYDADAATAASQLNAVNVVRNRSSIAPGEMQSGVVGSEFAGLSAVKQRAWLAILSDSVDPGNANIVAQIAEVWGPGTTTRANLGAMKTETVSQATAEGLGVVKVGHIEQARA